MKVIPKLFDSVVPNEFLDNSASRLPWERLPIKFNVRNESIAESLRKNQRKTVTLHKVYTTPARNTLKECEAI